MGLPWRQALIFLFGCTLPKIKGFCGDIAKMHEHQVKNGNLLRLETPKNHMIVTSMNYQVVNCMYYCQSMHQNHITCLHSIGFRSLAISKGLLHMPLLPKTDSDQSRQVPGARSAKAYGLSFTGLRPRTAYPGYGVKQTSTLYR